MNGSLSDQFSPLYIQRRNSENISITNPTVITETPKLFL
jgi:hypothetical protein